MVFAYFLKGNLYKKEQNPPQTVIYLTVFL